MSNWQGWTYMSTCRMTYCRPTVRADVREHLWFVHCREYTVHCTHCTVYTVHCVHCTVYTLYTVHTVHCVHCTHFTVCTLYSVHTVHSVHWTRRPTVVFSRYNVKMTQQLHFMHAWCDEKIVFSTLPHLHFVQLLQLSPPPALSLLRWAFEAE